MYAQSLEKPRGASAFHRGSRYAGEAIELTKTTGPTAQHNHPPQLGAPTRQNLRLTIIGLWVYQVVVVVIAAAVAAVAGANYEKQARRI